MQQSVKPLLVWGGSLSHVPNLEVVQGFSYLLKYWPLNMQTRKRYVQSINAICL